MKHKSCRLASPGCKQLFTEYLAPVLSNSKPLTAETSQKFSNFFTNTLCTQFDWFFCMIYGRTEAHLKKLIESVLPGVSNVLHHRS